MKKSIEKILKKNIEKQKSRIFLPIRKFGCTVSNVINLRFLSNNIIVQNNIIYFTP